MPPALGKETHYEPVSSHAGFFIFLALIFLNCSPFLDPLKNFDKERK